MSSVSKEINCLRKNEKEFLEISDTVTGMKNVCELCTCYENKKICPIEESQSAFYVRLLVKDEPGVFAKIAGLLSEENISLNSVIQKRKVNNCAEIVFVTYTVKNAAIREALAKIEALPVVTEISNVIRVHEANE